jgi:hypothetical protein
MPILVINEERIFRSATFLTTKFEEQSFIHNIFRNNNYNFPSPDPLRLTQNTQSPYTMKCLQVASIVYVVIALTNECTGYILQSGISKAVSPGPRQISRQASIQNIYEYFGNSSISKDESLKIIEFVTETQLSLCKEELALRELMHEKELRDLITIKDLESKTILLDEKVKNYVANDLKSNGACTARGILEFYLHDVHKELLLKGSFNARAVCTAIGKIIVFSCLPDRGV